MTHRQKSALSVLENMIAAGMKETMRRIKQIAIYLMFDDGNRTVVRSPERPMKTGLRTNIGWYIMVFGAFVIFGHHKEWQTLVNPMWTKEE